MRLTRLKKTKQKKMTTESPAPILYEHTVRGGGMWSKIIGRGKTLRLTDIEGGANVSMLLYHSHQKLERYNMPDTLKGQHVFFLTAPFCIHSDMGRIFCSITADTAGWHDTVCGCSNAETVRRKFGERSYQTARNDFYRNGRDCFLIELAKWDMGERDLVPNLNFFSKVVSDESGKLTFDSDHATPGAYVDLRFEMDTLVVLNTCPHPLDSAPEYAPKPVLMQVTASAPVPADDASRRSRPENARAFTTTEQFYTLSQTS